MQSEGTERKGWKRQRTIDFGPFDSRQFSDSVSWA